MPSGKKWKYDSKLLFLSVVSDNFFCDDKDAIKLSKIRECNTQRIICFIAFLISAKEY